MDDDYGKRIATQSLKKLGIKFHLSHKVTGAVNNGDSVTVTALDKKEQEIKIERIIAW
jgi:dihydrolipoamide dehydrogenase